MCSNGQLGNAGSPVSDDPAYTATSMSPDMMQILQRAGASLGSPTTETVPNRGPAHSEMFGRMLQAAEDYPAPKKYQGK